MPSKGKALWRVVGIQRWTRSSHQTPGWMQEEISLQNQNTKTRIEWQVHILQSPGITWSPLAFILYIWYLNIVMLFVISNPKPYSIPRGWNQSKYNNSHERRCRHSKNPPSLRFFLISPLQQPLSHFHVPLCHPQEVFFPEESSESYNLAAKSNQGCVSHFYLLGIWIPVALHC